MDLLAGSVPIEQGDQWDPFEALCRGEAIMSDDEAPTGHPYGLWLSNPTEWWSCVLNPYLDPNGNPYVPAGWQVYHTATPLDREDLWDIWCNGDGGSGFYHRRWKPAQPPVKGGLAESA